MLQRMSLGENIEALRVASGHSYADLANAIGTDAQQIHYLVKNESVRSKFAPAIAEFYEVDLATLITATPDEVIAASKVHGAGSVRESRAPYTTGKSNWTPVVGEARLGDGGFFEQTSYEPGTAGYVKFPRERDAYALRCKGDSMRDRILPGDFVIILPHKRVSIGDLVMCQTRDGQRMIKQLGRTRDEITEFLSANEKFGTITFDEDQIAHIHYAIGPIPADFYDADPG